MNKVYLLVIIFTVTVSCSSLKPVEPLELKNNIILQDGFSLGTSLKHKFKMNLKSNFDIAIKQIDYELRIPNFKDKVRGSFEIEKLISLNKDFGFQEVNVLSEGISYLSICDHFNAMFASEKDVFSMRMDIYFYYSDTKYILKDVEVKFDNSTLWAQLRNKIVEKGCSVMSILSILKDIWK